MEERHAIMNPFGHGLHLNRSAFDEMLRGTVDSVEKISRDRRLTLCKGVFRSLRRMEDQRWNIEVELDGKQITFTTKWIIDATGRKAAVATKVSQIKIKINVDLRSDD